MSFPQIHGTKNPSFNLVPTWFPITPFAVVTAATRGFRGQQNLLGYQKEDHASILLPVHRHRWKYKCECVYPVFLEAFLVPLGCETPTLVGFGVGPPQKASSVFVLGFPNNLRRVSTEAFPTSIQKATGAGQSKPQVIWASLSQSCHLGVLTTCSRISPQTSCYWAQVSYSCCHLGMYIWIICFKMGKMAVMGIANVPLHQQRTFAISQTRVSVCQYSILQGICYL